MPLKYGGLVGGASPKDPLEGTPDPQGLKDPKLFVYPNGRVKSVAEGVVLPVYDTDTASVSFDSDTPAENGVLIVANTASDGTGSQVLYVQLDGSFEEFRPVSQEAGGSSTQSGDGTATQFTIAHGLSATPTVFQVVPGSADANGAYHVTADSTNITVTYGAAPSSGTDNVVLRWFAHE